MAAGRSPDGAARRAATTTIGSGSTRTIPNIILLAGDQGAIVTVNGGETWSSWYNQPTAQFYHVSTDNAFPYRVCGGQQESGSACVVEPRRRRDRSRCASGRRSAPRSTATSRPIPMDPDVVYGGKLTRFDRRTGQAQDITPPRGPNYRVLRTAPVLFSPTERGLLFFASNTLWKTTNGGQNWTEISPDLSRETWEVPASVGVYRGTPAAQPTRRGVIYTVALSTIDQRIVWAGTDDGLIHLTRDAGTTWTNVTPAALGPVGEGLDARGLALRHARPRTPPSTRFGSTICGRTSCGRATAAGRGWRSPTACRPRRDQRRP